MSTTTKYFTQAELSLAAYGTFTVGTILATDLTNPTVGMSDSQATNFIGQGWAVAAQYTDPTTGVSATVFQDSAGKKTLAIRGTELAASDLLAAGLLALGIPSSLNLQFTALKTQIDAWLTNGTLGTGFTVAGHSLGGYLAAAVKQTYPQATDAYLFNAPGVGGPLGNLANALTSTLGLSGTPSGNIWNLRSSEGFPLISGLGYQLGTSISIQTEAASNVLANHSIVNLTDALAVQSLYAKLVPSLTQAQINTLVDASGATMNLTLESALDALRVILLGPATTQTVTGDRNGFYTNLYNLTSDARYTALAATVQLTVLAGLTASDMAAMAGNSNAQGLATRYALAALNPFVLTGADYSAFNTGGALELYDPNTGTGALTGQYLTDRSAFLERKLWFSAQDKAPVNSGITYDGANNHPFENEPTYFEDVASGYKIAQGGPFDNTHHYFFGGNSGDGHAGAAVEDHLYGGTGNDTLTGGKGNDLMMGGADNDTYIINAGDGTDTIEDKQGANRVILNGKPIDLLIKQADGTYASPEGAFTAAMQGTDLVVTDVASGTQTILNKDFQEGDFGIRFQDAPTDPQTALTINGDIIPTDTNPNATGIQANGDALGNPIGTAGPYEDIPRRKGGAANAFEWRDAA